MRLAAQMRGGFYPAPEQAIAHATRFLRAPGRESFAILDPCAGEGAAIRQIAELLACPLTKAFAIELDESRSDKIHDALPGAHVLAPASFFGCRATRNSFSLIWLNPPFDYSYGSYRVEHQFLQAATEWLMPEGVIALVCPENVFDEFSDARRHFAIYFDRCQIVPFPEAHRSFKEVIVFGHKRVRPASDEGAPSESVQAPEGFVYHIPPGPGPKLFQKIEPTEPEFQRLLASSPLRAHLTKLPDVPLPSPPLALGIGHVALLLASGHLDGVVQPEGKPPHVVRGSSRKHEYVSSVSETDNADGSTTKKTILSQRIDLVIRAVDLTGSIHTFAATDTEDEPIRRAA